MVKNWSVWSWDSKIDCISRVNSWNELIFSCWCKFRKAKSYFNEFWVGVIKNGLGHLVCETLKYAVYFKNELMVKLIFYTLSVMQ